MSRLQLSFAASACDRFAALREGTVVPQGVQLNHLTMPVEDIFLRQVRRAEFDVAEMSLSSYVLGRDQGDDRFVALPVFPSRYFRHQTMFVRTGAGIGVPADLAGRRVGVPEYQITAGVWQRGILGEHHGLDVDAVTWVSGGVERAGRTEKITLDLPDRVRLEPAAAGSSLTDLVARGEVDAMFTAHVPAAVGAGLLEPLFPDARSAEQDYFRTTGIFPVMHVLVVRREILERHPWVATSLVEACTDAKSAAEDALRYRSALLVMLPWLAQELEATIDVMGEDYWPYGLEANRHVLETFLRYSRRQGLAKREWAVEDLFDTSAEERFTI